MEGTLEHQAVSFTGQRDQNTSLSPNENSEIETDRSNSQENFNNLMFNKEGGAYSGASASSSTNAQNNSENLKDKMNNKELHPSVGLEEGHSSSSSNLQNCFENSNDKMNNNKLLDRACPPEGRITSSSTNPQKYSENSKEKINNKELHPNVGLKEGHSSSSSSNFKNYLKNYFKNSNARMKNKELRKNRVINNELLENVGPDKGRITSSSTNPQNYFEILYDKRKHSEQHPSVGPIEDERNHDSVRDLRYLKTYFNKPRSFVITSDTIDDINTNHYDFFKCIEFRMGL